jgi:branched-subunit amino acid aminotransferase/4-amino-4-deoxychorismate lyase
MPLRARLFPTEKEGFTMWEMATTFLFAGGKSSPFGSGGTLVEASAGLPAGSYTTLRTYGGNGVVRLDQHVRRLVESLDAAERVALEPAAVRSALAHALRTAGHPESRVRITFAPPRLFVTVEPFEPVDEELRRAGVACVTVPGRRERPEAKDTRFLATAEAAYATLPAGVHEGLMVGDDGAILEGLSSNFFAVHRGRLRTEETRALRGVTRSMVLELARPVLPRGESALHVDQLAEASECFLTSVSREVLPVVRIDGVEIAGGAPGPVTGELIRRFAAAVENEVERLP